MRTYSKGFTLIELLIVISVIGVLAVTVLVALNPLTQFKKARDAGRKTALKNLQNALEQYFNDTGSYPVSAGCYSDQTSGCWSLTGGTALLGTNAANYLKAMPQDPSQTTGVSCTLTTARTYAYVSNGTTYTISTRLENTTDPSIASSPYPASGSPCSGGHNYQMVSVQQ